MTKCGGNQCIFKTKSSQAGLSFHLFSFSCYFYHQLDFEDKFKNCICFLGFLCVIIN